MLRYDFYDPEAPSFTDIRQRASTDKALGAELHTKIPAAVDCLINEARTRCLRFAGLDAAKLPFTRDVVEGLIKRLVASYEADCPLQLGEMADACRFAIDHFGLRHPPRWLSLSQEAAQLAALVECTYLARNQHRLFIFMAARNLAQDAINDDVMMSFQHALKLDPSIKHPENVWLGCIYAYNRARKYTGWPQQALTVPRIRRPGGRRWDGFPQGLLAEGRRFLDRPPTLLGWIFPGPDKSPRRPNTIASELDLIRICASALAISGFPIERINGLRPLVVLPNLRSICNGIIKAAGGDVTRLAKKKFELLGRIARHSGVLNAEEADDVMKLLDAYGKSHDKFCKLNPTRSKQYIKDYEDPCVVDALFELPYVALAQIEEMPLTRSRACTAKCATILAIGLDAPLTPSQMCALLLEYLIPIEFDGVESFLIRIPGNAVVDGNERNYILTPLTASLVRRFIDMFRPRLELTPSPYLFPGLDGEMLHASTYSSQMRKFVSERLKTRFTPELIRRIAEDIILKENPASFETVRNTLGHQWDDMAIAAAKTKLRRGVHDRYLDLLTSGKLSAKSGKKVVIRGQR